MFKYFAIILIIMVCLPNVSSAIEDGNYGIAGLEFGPFAVCFDSLSKIVLPSELGNWNFDFLSFNLLLGYKYRRIMASTRIELARTAYGGDIESEPRNMAYLHTFSMLLSPILIQSKYLDMFLIGGYKYAYFKAHPSDNKGLKYISKNKGATIGIRTNFYSPLKISDSSIFTSTSYEYCNSKYALERWSFSVGMLNNDLGNPRLIFKIIRLKNIVRLYSFTIGLYSF